MRPKLLIVTGNEMKYKELSHALGEFFDCEQAIYDQPEIQGKAQDIIRHKLKTAYEIFKQPVLVDDVSVHMGALNGFPGPYMKDFFSYITPYNLAQKFPNTPITAVCLLGFADGQNEIISEGRIDGKIVIPKDEHKEGKQFDIFLKPKGMDKVMQEFSIEEKNTFSHRGIALENLIKILENR